MLIGSIVKTCAQKYNNNPSLNTIMLIGSIVKTDAQKYNNNLLLYTIV